MGNHWSAKLFIDINNVVLIPGLSALVYYALMFPAITTLAHLLGLVIGAVMTQPLNTLICLSLTLCNKPN